LNVTQPEAEELVVSLILDGRIKGKIDQVQGLLVLDRLYVTLILLSAPSFYCYV
jgi:COP9 signalosome complex subunit 2